MAGETHETYEAIFEYGEIRVGVVKSGDKFRWAWLTSKNRPVSGALYGPHKSVEGCLERIEAIISCQRRRIA